MFHCTVLELFFLSQFPKWMLSDEDLLELEVLESDTHLEGMKRYSEFSKFHNILMASPLSINAKGSLKKKIKKFVHH